MFQSRISRLQDALSASEMDCAILTPGSCFFYFTGLKFHLMERPVLAIIRPDHPPAIILPELERSKAESGLPGAVLFPYDETAKGRERALHDAAAGLVPAGSTIGIEPLRCRAFELWLLQAAMTGSCFVDGSALLNSLRMIKQPDEILLMKKAAQIAEQALLSLLPHIRTGQTEKEIAANLVMELLRAGSDPELPFEPIVASGPNSALPHAVPTERRLQQADLLLFDWGARSGEYISDITRTFAVGETDPRLRQLFEVVLAANRRGREVAVPGTSGAEIDRATTQVLVDAGFAELVRHRTGHGIGLEAHEHPYISQDQHEPLLPGMTFTIEPGLYMPGLGGIRIEDDVVLTESGAESLSTLPREWSQL